MGGVLASCTPLLSALEVLGVRVFSSVVQVVRKAWLQGVRLVCHSPRRNRDRVGSRSQSNVSSTFKCTDLLALCLLFPICKMGILACAQELLGLRYIMYGAL